MNIRYHDPDFLCEYVHSKVVDEKNYFILLDEVQYVNDFESVLISFLHIKNAIGLIPLALLILFLFYYYQILSRFKIKMKITKSI